MSSSSSPSAEKVSLRDTYFESISIKIQQVENQYYAVYIGFEIGRKWYIIYIILYLYYITKGFLAFGRRYLKEEMSPRP